MAGILKIRNKATGVWEDVPALVGSDGADGTNGTDGKSAYQIWLDAGNTGSEAAFLASLKGEPGEDGAPGSDGTIGIIRAWSADNAIVNVRLSATPQLAVTPSSFDVYNVKTGMAIAVSTVLGYGVDYSVTIAPQTDDYGITFVGR